MKLLLFFLVLVGAESLAAEQILTDGDVVKMVQTGVAQDVILKLIADSPVQFAVEANHVVRWKQAGVPDDVVRAMMARQRSAPSIQYVPFSSEVRIIPAERVRKRWLRLKIR